MKKWISGLLTLCMLLSCFSAFANSEAIDLGVRWSTEKLTEGDLGVLLAGAEDGQRAVLALYDGDMLAAVDIGVVENSSAELSVTVTEVNENMSAKLLLWENGSLNPVAEVLSTITPDGIIDGAAKRLPYVGAVSGTVTVDGEGISEITVKLGELEAVTNENGVYIFEEVVEGEYTIEVKAPEDTEGETAKKVTVTRNETVTADFKLKTIIYTGTVSGTVTVDGIGISGVTVKLGELEAVTDETGKYTFSEVPEGKYTITANTPIDTRPLGETSGEVTVERDKTTEADFAFETIIYTGDVSGTVTVDGNVISGVTVTLGEKTELTGEDGTYTFSEVPEGKYIITVETPEETKAIGETAVEVTVERDKTATVDFAFETVIYTGTISGIVTVDGNGVSGITVTLDDEKTVTTDGEGKYAFEEVPVGEHTVALAAPEGTEGETIAEVLVERDKDATANFEFDTVYGTILGTVTIDGEAAEGITVTIKGTEEKDTVTDGDGLYLFKDILIGEYTVSVETPEGTAAVTANSITADLTADQPSIRADFIFESFITEPGEIWVSDNQINNKKSSVGYHKIGPFAGKYTISFKLTIEERGDNAVLLGDSSNGDLIYGTSSAILLFNGANFTVKSGDGNGNYTDTGDGIVLCAATVGKTYTITFEGDISLNTYKITIDDGSRIYESKELSARKNGSVIDTIAFVNNSKSTSVGENGTYSNYNFYVEDVYTSGTTEEIVYNGFAGKYFGIKVNGKYVRGNNGRLTADYATVADDSAKFLPRDMADGSFAFMCLSSSRRITTATNGQQLASADYDYNSDNQHWLMEESENYTEDHLSYYLRSLDNDLYIGLSGNYLAAVSETNKVEIVFEPLPDEDQSPLYKLSKTEVYSKLSRKQRENLIRVYETLAGDVFDRYSDSIVGAEWTVRLRMDNIINTYILKGSYSEEEQLTKLQNFFNSTDGHVVNNTNTYTVRTDIPGAEGVTCTIDDGEYGDYDFWRGTMLKGTKYTLTMYAADGSVEQTIDLYVQDDGTPKTNSQTFLKAFVQIPYVCRRYIKSVKIRSDSANSFNCGANDLYIRINWVMGQDQMRATITHELNHSLDMSNGSWSQGGGWSQAMANDMFMVSEYANSTAYEDFAEFGRLYFVCYGNRDRQRALQLIFPNRYASYWRLRHNNLGGFELWEDTEYLEY